MKETHISQGCTSQFQPGETAQFMFCVDFFFLWRDCIVLYLSSITCSYEDYLCCKTSNTWMFCMTGQFLQIIKSVWNYSLILEERHNRLAALLTLSHTEPWGKLVKMINYQFPIPIDFHSGSLCSRQRFILSDFPGHSDIYI